MVVACIALAVALSGVGYAAVALPRDSVGTLQLKRNAVTATKIRNGSVTPGKLARNAVTAAKLADDAVTGAKLADAAVGAPQLADEAVGTAELAEGAVNSTKITDGAVARADLAAGLVMPPVVAFSVSPATTNSPNFVDLPGAVVGVVIPPGLTLARLLIRFSGESLCHAGLQWCSIRILVDGTEAEPAAGAEFAFDSTDFDTKSGGAWEARAMERSLVVGPGTHVVWVQWRVRTTETFSLDDWTLVVEPHLTG